MIIKKDGTLETSKNKKALHGIGLSSVRSSIEKYNGYMECETNNGNFKVMLTLYF